tara:strand:- start:13 stop:738 length:726 start_codon:yes stop_codon:yes gene_type:complete
MAICMKICQSFLNLFFSKMTSKLIIISGIDGSGKSTNIDIIKDYFLKRKLRIISIWTRGGYSPGFLFIKSIFRIIFGKKLLPSGYSKKRKKILKNNFVSNLWINLAIIDLIFFWGFYLRAKMYFMDIIICDRYILDTLIDFKINFGNINLESNLLWKLLNILTPRPDSSFILKIPFPESQRRLNFKVEPFPDKFEYAKYRYELYEKYFSNSYYKNIDSSLDIKIVSKNICSEISKLINYKT